MHDESRALEAPMLSRRGLLGLGLGLIGAAALPELAEAAPQSRFITLRSLHTGEKLRAEYFTRGKYNKDALRALSRLMRDHRNGQVHAIDPKLFDVLYQLQRKLGSQAEYHVISGYRSPETNAMLARTGDGVATNSFHLRGMAIDIRMPKVDLRKLHRAALTLRRGGVGYYPESNFIHLDVGPVRRWGGVGV
ncbi:MAG TPA: DUF882 domain-containing protein [Alphaproteobacteria bacterium]|nr:DUF882 domain-containing protein [Alphaproteobacteria bacterium]